MWVMMGLGSLSIGAFSIAVIIAITNKISITIIMMFGWGLLEFVLIVTSLMAVSALWYGEDDGMDE